MNFAETVKEIIQDISVRPERLTVTGPDARAERTGDNLLPGRVVEIVNMGAVIHTIIETAARSGP